MKSTFDRLEVPSPTSAVLALDSNGMKVGSASRIKENAVMFPKVLNGFGGSLYERVDNMDNGTDAVYVPFGAVQLRQELGWRAKYDTHKGKLFFICLNDATKGTWLLPTVPDEVLRFHGVISNDSGRSKFAASNGNVEKEGEEEKVRYSLSNRIEEGEDGDVETSTTHEGIPYEKGIPKFDEQNSAYHSCFSDNMERVGANYSERSDSVSTQSPVPSSGDYNNTVACGAQLDRSSSGVSLGIDPVPTEPRSLLALMNVEECAAAPLISRSVDPQTFSTEQSLSDMEGFTHSHVDMNSFYSKNGKEETKLEIMEARLHEEKNVRHCFEKEEPDDRNVPLNVVQKRFDQLPFHEERAEEEGEQTHIPDKKEKLPFVPNNMTGENEMFLRNSRLSEIGDENNNNEFAPLEKLLRDYSSCNICEYKSAIPVSGTFANLYHPPSAKRDEPMSFLRFDVKSAVYGQIHVPHDTHSENRKIDLSPAPLFGTRRHQLEMERRVTRRERDNLERAPEKRYQRIVMPPDTHTQLSCEPSNHFARERQTIFDPLGIVSSCDSPQGKIASPEEPQQPQQEQLTAKLHSADLSPISFKTFIRSPSPAKHSVMIQISGGTIITEAYEAKYKVELAAMESLMELYQTFMITKPEPYMPKKEIPGIRANTLDANKSMESLSEKYADRLIRIQELYSYNNEKGRRLQFHGNSNTNPPIRTPVLPFALNYQDAVEDTLPYSIRAAPKEQKVRFCMDVSTCQINCMNDSMHDGNMPQSSSNSFSVWQNRALNAGAKRGMKTPKCMTNDINTRRATSENVLRAHCLPHRLITTPVITPVNGPVPNDGISLSRPVLCWDVKRSGNVLISHKGTTCMADASQVVKLTTSEKEGTCVSLPSVLIPMYALGTIGISEGEFIFEVRIDVHPASTHTSDSGLFAVGVATKYYRGTYKANPAYLFRSNGTIVATPEDEKGVPYGCPYHSSSHITVYLDLVQQQLSFFLNGRPLGVAFKFRGVRDPEPLFPVVVLSGEGDTASFVPPSVPLLPRHLKPPLEVESQVIGGR